jgi:hypothetical protein
VDVMKAKPLDAAENVKHGTAAVENSFVIP